MPQPSKVDLLPPEVRADLEQRLIHSGFSGYTEFTTWLNEQGFEISRSSVNRWGRKLKLKIDAIAQATEQARAIAEACPDDEGLLLDAAQRLAQHQIYEALLAIDIDPSNIGADQLTKLVRALADLGRGNVSLKRFQTEVRTKRDEANANIKEITAQAGVPQEVRHAIELELLGIG